MTNKTARGAPRFRARVAARLARELVGSGPLCLVHGAGSWGHPLALRFGIGKRRLAGAALRDAVHRTQSSVSSLRGRVATACRSAGLPIVEIPASAVAWSRRGDVAFDAALFGFYASRGLVPLTGGDVVLDDRLGARVLSGDEILRILARELPVTRVVFASDVDGVMRDGRPLPQVSVDEASAWPIDARRDATGGMGGKLREAAAVAKAGVPVFIVNGLAPGRLRAAARGARVPGTRIG